MLQMKSVLGKYGVHCFMLPVFFVLHGYLQYDGLVSVSAAMKAAALSDGEAALPVSAFSQGCERWKRSFSVLKSAFCSSGVSLAS